eukprot:814252_1
MAQQNIPSSPQEKQPSEINEPTHETIATLYLPTSIDHSSESQSTHVRLQYNNQKVPSNTSEHKNNDTSIFDDFVVRSFCMNSVLFFFCIFSFPLWFGSIVGDKQLLTAYILSAFAMIIIFNASICGLMLSIFDKFDKPIPARKIIIYFITILYMLGSLLYFVSACHFARSLNDMGHIINKDFSSLSGIIWT